jgi:DnaJ-class molecular chaperone
MLRIEPMSRKESRKAYGKMKKAELIELLIGCNEALDLLNPTMTFLDARIENGVPPDGIRCCPVCGGNGMVSGGFYDKAGVEQWSSITASEPCRTCKGTGTIYIPPK